MRECANCYYRGACIDPENKRTENNITVCDNFKYERMTREIENYSNEEQDIINRIKEILESETWLKEDSDGLYNGEIDADYRDELDGQTIIKIFKSNNPRDEFYDILNKGYLDSDHEYYNDLFKTIEKHFDDEYDDPCHHEWKDFIRDWVYENVCYNYPYSHYLNQDICINIMVDTGDGNYGFTLNQLFGYYANETLEDEHRQFSSLVWLMKQQGYTIGQIERFVKDRATKGSKLLNSIWEECLNTSSSMNALTFFVKMTLEEALDLYELTNNIRFHDRGCEKNGDTQMAWCWRHS